MSDGYGPPSTPEIIPRKIGMREIVAWVIVAILAISTVVMGVSLARTTHSAQTKPSQPTEGQSVPKTVPMWETLGITKEQWDAEYAKAQERMDAALDRALNPNVIDPAKCEFVLTPDRAKAFLKCPVPKDFKIPNWPDRQAPLNKD